MNILILSHKFHPNIGGIESVSEMLALEFVKAGHEVKVLTWSIDNTDKDFSFSVVRNPGIIKLFKHYNWADVVFENNPCLRLSWPVIFFQKPIVVVLHTWISRINGRIGWQDKLKQLWLKRADRVIACSDALRQKCFRTAIVIENSYNDALFQYLPEVPRIHNFIFLGRLVSNKGADIAIKVLSKLNQHVGRFPKHSLTIIGDGNERLNLMKLVERLELINQVVFKGPLSGVELVNVLNEHKYILVPSVWEEPFGLVALEGMACGCLPIVSNGGGLPDAIGKAGVTFRSRDVDDLEKVIVNLLSNPLLEMKLRNEVPKHLAEHLSSVVAKKYLKIIESVVTND